MRNYGTLNCGTHKYGTLFGTHNYGVHTTMVHTTRVHPTTVHSAFIGTGTQKTNTTWNISYSSAPNFWYTAVHHTYTACAHYTVLTAPDIGRSK